MSVRRPKLRLMRNFEIAQIGPLTTNAIVLLRSLVACIR